MGRITIGMDEGFQAAGTELDHDMRRDVATDYYQEGMQYDASKSVVSKAVGLVALPDPECVEGVLRCCGEARG